MIKLMGEKSGIIGILLAFLLGSVAAEPLYATFLIGDSYRLKNKRRDGLFLGNQPPHNRPEATN